MALAGLEEARTSVGAVAGVGALPEGFAGCPGTSRTSGFCQWVIVQSGSRKSMMLITNWLSWASSSGVSTARGGRTHLRSWYVSEIHFRRIGSSGSFETGRG